MKVIIVAAAIIATCNAIISQPPACSNSPKTCAPRVITSCPRKDPIDACPTCCCDSSENVEFYDPDSREPWCSAPPAIYTVTFVGTWTGVCQPDYYPSNAHWSPPTGASHNTGYQMWDACMENVSPGVARVSQFGDTSIIEGEYGGNSSHILDTFKAGLINGGGRTSSELSVDKYHQWASAVTMLAPSLDRMVGVANLRLCDGVDWKKTVKVCSELFSTATRSDRVHPLMQRNSVQWNNCSFGYFTFTFKQYQNSSQQEPTNCQKQSEDICPAKTDRPQNCRVCCCKTSDNAEFFRPDSASVPTCPATQSAVYKVSLVPTITNACHSSYPFVGGGVENTYFSDLILSTYGAQWLASGNYYDTCGVGPPELVNYLTQTESAIPFVAQMFQAGVDIGIRHDYYFRENVLERGNRKRRSGHISLSPSFPYLNIIAELLPQGPDNQWVGVSGVNLCGVNGWKDHVQVCLPLLANPNTTINPDVQMQLQGNNCSFGHAVIQRRYPSVPSHPPSTCMPGSMPPQNLTTCCAHDFIIDGQIIRRVRRSRDSLYQYDLLVAVTLVHYDDINHIQVDDVVSVKVCDLPFRIRFKQTYQLAGSRECGTHDLEISETGVIIDLTGRSGTYGQSCASYINDGNCDDPR